MAIVFPNTPAAYRELMEQLAVWHGNIEHDDEAAPRFVVINEAMTPPFKAYDLGELVQKQRSSLRYNAATGQTRLIMVCVEWASDLKRQGERPVEYADQAFILLGKVPKDDWTKRGEVMELAYNTGTEILNWLVEFFHLNSRLGILEDITVDPVGPTVVDNLYGYRFDWRLKLYKGAGFDTDNFGGNAPERIEI